MKNYSVFTWAALALVVSCAPATNNKMAKAELIGQEELMAESLPAALDTTVGITNSEKASFVQQGVSRLFTYNTCVVETRLGDFMGDAISVLINGSESKIALSKPDDPVYFSGVYGQFLFMNEGTGSEAVFVVYSLKQEKEVARFSIAEEPMIDDEKIVIWDRLQNEPKEKPDCPEAKEWQEAHLAVGYAERVLFDLSDGSIERTEELKCYAIQ